MIVFIEDINLVKYFNRAVIFNLSSYYSGYNNITNLITMANMSNTSEYLIAQYVDMHEFDINYMNYVFNNKDLFNFSLEQIEIAGWTLINKTNDLHNSEYVKENIMTEYEERFVKEGIAINRLETMR